MSSNKKPILIIVIENRSFYLFPEEIEDLEEEFFKIPHDSFSLKTMVAKKGDNITINFYNTEANKKHNFIYYIHSQE